VTASGHGAADQRVGPVGEAGQHEQEVAAPVGRQRQREPRHAVEHDEDGAHEGEGTAGHLAPAQALAEQQGAQRHDRQRLDDDQQRRVGRRRSGQAPVAERERAGEAHHAHPDDAPGVTPLERRRRSLEHAGDRDQDGGADHEPYEGEERRRQVVEHDAGGDVRRRVDEVGGEEERRGRAHASLR
jgi:hypothetical protein